MHRERNLVQYATTAKLQVGNPLKGSSMNFLSKSHFHPWGVNAKPPHLTAGNGHPAPGFDNAIAGRFKSGGYELTHPKKLSTQHSPSRPVRTYKPMQFVHCFLVTGTSVNYSTELHLAKGRTLISFEVTIHA